MLNEPQNLEGETRQFNSSGGSKLEGIKGQRTHEEKNDGSRNLHRLLCQTIFSLSKIIKPRKTTTKRTLRDPTVVLATESQEEKTKCRLFVLDIWIRYY
ncbi:hypothetical protein RUM43_001280 [Polyplax serrata]|uniref:Uncharacterized protein n=1 Tax=Polyplax serrata TaxID=468196 RepID=A0AAN8SF36_POLSC